MPETPRPAAPLGTVRIRLLPFDIAEVGQCEYTFFLGNQVFDIHFAGNGGDLCASVVSKAVADALKLFLDNGENLAFIGQDAGELLDLLGDAVGGGGIALLGPLGHPLLLLHAGLFHIIGPLGHRRMEKRLPWAARFSMAAHTFSME